MKSLSGQRLDGPRRGTYNVAHARAADHDPLRVRTSRARAVRRQLAVREVCPALEYETDPSRRILGDHARDASVPPDGYRRGPRARVDLRCAGLSRLPVVSLAAANSAQPLVHLVY